jgi:murein DD-endopeptidase MepM/ murein hydrolase activator NlpD
MLIPLLFRPKYPIYSTHKNKKWPLLSLFGLLISGCTVETPERIVYLKEGEILVQRGDTISSIAARHHISIKALVECNRLLPPYGLKNIKKLTLPSGQWTSPADNGHTNPVLLKEKETVQWTTVSEDPEPLASENPILLGEIDGEAELDSEADSGLETRLIQDPQELDWDGEVDGGVRDAVDGSRPKKKIPPKTKEPPHANWGSAGRTGDSKKKIKKVRFCRPVSGAVTKKFQKNKHGAPSKGIRFKASKGCPVYAAADGTVLLGGKLKGDPSKAVVLVKHNDKWTSCYRALAKSSVSKDQFVKQGDLLGTSEGPEMIFELRDQDRAVVDPEKYLQ